MNLITSFLACTLLLLSACGRQQAPTPLPPQKPILGTLFSVPATLSPGTLITKKINSPTALTQDRQAGNLLQIALGLRDAARGKARKIAPMAAGAVCNLSDIKTNWNFSTRTIEESSTTLLGQHTADQLLISIENTQAETTTPRTLLQFIPAVNGERFSSEFLDLVYDTLEIGYASNEISLMLTLDDRQATLCRRGSEYCMNVTLAPHEIRYCIDGYGIEAQEFLITMLNIPKAAPIAKKEQVTLAKKVLFILMPRDFQDDEFSGTHAGLAKAGHILDVASLAAGNCVGSAGLQITPTHLLNSMTPTDFDQYDALVITGGFGSPTFLWNNEEVHAVVRYFHEHKKLVATICWASVVPARAGILTNLPATVYPTDDAKQIFTENNVIFNDVLCVPLEKEHIITAQSPLAIEPFVENILKQLQSEIAAPPLTPSFAIARPEPVEGSQSGIKTSKDLSHG